ncbi:MAG: DUF2970 domain-containing protein [Gammaproteobacteria bacterium]|nr:MAG: DUF2970 domain-containing protein [Gammaproteobacteria bacterium]
MNDKDKAPTLLQVAMSVLAAGFGVQKNEIRERDFKYGKPSQFIIVGLVITVLFILTVVGIVMLVMKVAGV